MLVSHDALVSARVRRRRLPGVSAPRFHLSEALRRAAAGRLGSTHLGRVHRGVGADVEVGDLDVAAAVGPRMRERYFLWEEGRRHAFAVYESTAQLFTRFAEDYLVEPDGNDTL